ncbi:hypothetical protein [Actinoplanes sp. N902-109]|uniref:hypothetical protein n=1 Tax=Actinoplanes sp. (strain N902-109) TaxID=649831 RepID=UPI00032935A8|nr:hypothetical protein [Actinoplanes sp. N902-109]AGL16262.1 hypothetical protein L083_2752 [Actinoplanes sp. N902-109]
MPRLVTARSAPGTHPGVGAAADADADELITHFVAGTPALDATPVGTLDRLTAREEEVLRGS